MFFPLSILFNLNYFEYLYDVIYEAESANINKHHLQLTLKYVAGCYLKKALFVIMAMVHNIRRARRVANFQALRLMNPKIVSRF
jgi:hypothetical protein